VERILAVIPARGGSKGLPNKNIRDLAGLPLIAHSIRCARLSPLISRTIVSTDSEKIAEVAGSHGADVPFLRPAELASDTAAMWPVVRHALAEAEKQEGKTYDAVLLLDPTTPGRIPADIEKAASLLAKEPSAAGVVAASEPGFSPLWESVVDREGWMVDLFAEHIHHSRRQDVPTVYRINGCLYLWRADFVRNETESWRDGKHLILVLPEARAIHIDELYQFQLADLQIRHKLIELPWMT
jgi:CMP-N,N'-diacetyllegionaminic acid synthase